MSTAVPLPRTTFGIIVLNGHPFLRYNLRSLYPWAHEIVVVEGASPLAAHVATPDGHSIDGTLEDLRRFAQDEDPERKITVVTAEDDGHPNGFWPGEKDEQSQAYARRATGDWLWQVDVDEFYDPNGIERVFGYLRQHPDTTCLTFNAHHFWGGFAYVLDGGAFRSRGQGEPGYAYRRVFQWGRGYRYVSHRPPTVHDSAGRNMVTLRKRNATRGLGVRMYHYTNVFPSQVVPKGAYYANQGWAHGIAQRRNFERFLEPLDARRALRIYDHWGTFNWVLRFRGNHPPAIVELRSDLAAGALAVEQRPTDDIDRVLGSGAYQVARAVLTRFEWLRSELNGIRQLVSLWRVTLGRILGRGARPSARIDTGREPS